MTGTERRGDGFDDRQQSCGEHPRGEMTADYDRKVARQVLAEVNRQERDRLLLADQVGLSVRQLKRRLYAEVAFRPAELAAVAEALGQPTAFFLPAAPSAVVGGD